MKQRGKWYIDHVKIYFWQIQRIIFSSGVKFPLNLRSMKLFFLRVSGFEEQYKTDVDILLVYYSTIAFVRIIDKMEKACFFTQSIWRLFKNNYLLSLWELLFLVLIINSNSFLVQKIHGWFSSSVKHCTSWKFDVPFFFTLWWVFVYKPQYTCC